MKLRIITIGLVLSIILLLLWSRRSSHNVIAMVPSELAVSNTDVATQKESRRTLNALQSANTENSSTTNKDPRYHPTNDVKSWWAAQSQTPIDFYGKVVDEGGNPVSGAQVYFEWDVNLFEHKSKHSSAESDAGGLFALWGVTGSGLDVRISKKGYYPSRGNGHCSDSFAPLGPANPVVYTLRKKGNPEPLLKLDGVMGGTRQYRLDSKGKPTDISFYTGNRLPTGEGQFEVAFTMQGSENGDQRQFQWDCVVSIPGGGLQPAPTEFAFSAPDTGYQPMDEIKSESDPNKWADQFERSYYVQLADGNYGIVKLTVMCGSDPLFGVDVLVNRAGSRNLEYDKYLPGNIFVDQSSP